jgi:DNA transformation protein
VRWRHHHHFHHGSPKTSPTCWSDLLLRESREARRLLSALGLYCDGVIFAIVSKEQIYLKVDDESRPTFEAKGMEPFRPRARKSTGMPYFTLADPSYDDDALRSWARLAINAGLGD